MYSVNLAVQLLPLRTAQDNTYEIIDAAIAVLRQSGLKHAIGPFETTIEGPYEQVFKVLSEMQETARQSGAEEIIVNLKLHRSFTQDLRISDKTGKYSAS